MLHIVACRRRSSSAGRIPTEIGQLSRLNDLLLSENHLTGGQAAEAMGCETVGRENEVAVEEGARVGE